MGKTLFGSLGRSASTFLNRTPVPYVSRGRSGYGMPTRPAGMEAQMRAMGSNGTLYAIVDRIITSYSQVNWRLYRKAKSGREEDRVEVTSHAALDLWSAPNPFMTGPAFRECTQQHEELTGEQWWVVASDERARNLPLELWPVRPDRMEPTPDAEEFLTGYTYCGPSGERVPLGKSEVIFQRRPNPLDPYRGMGPVQTVLTDLDGVRYSKEWNRNFFINSAEPGGIVEVDKHLSDDEFDEALERWGEQHKGVANAHRVALLENGLKWVDRKYTMREMQFVELAAVGRETIREAFGFPKPLLGAVDDVNRANAVAAEVVFARWLLVPRLERTKAALNTRLLPLYGRMGEGLEFDYDSPVPDDLEAEAAQLTSRANAAAALVREGFEPAGTLSACGLPEIAFSGTPTPPPARSPAALARSAARLALPAAPPQRSEWDAAMAGLFKAQDDSALDQVRTDQEHALSRLLTEWDGVESTWVDALAARVQAAVDDGDSAALAALTVDSDAAADTLRGALGSMARLAAERMVQEAAAQGVTVAAPAVDEALSNRAHIPAVWAAFGGELADIATATAALLGAGMATAAGREALRLFTPGADGSGIASAVKGFLRGLSNRLKLDQLGGALHRATNLGRLATLEAAPVATYWASERMDLNTCLPCSEIDGTVFDDLTAVRAAYGAGPYRLCEGGIRCRGTVVATWTPPTEEGS
jgi:HK97 family phage portal protein